MITSSGHVATPLMIPAAAPDTELILAVERLLAVHIEKAGKCCVIMEFRGSCILLLRVVGGGTLLSEGIAERQRRSSACAGVGLSCHAQSDLCVGIPELKAAVEVEVMYLLSRAHLPRKAARQSSCNLSHSGVALPLYLY